MYFRKMQSALLRSLVGYSIRRFLRFASLFKNRLQIPKCTYLLTLLLLGLICCWLHQSYAPTQGPNNFSLTRISLFGLIFVSSARTSFTLLSTVWYIQQNLFIINLQYSTLYIYNKSQLGYNVSSKDEIIYNDCT